MNFIHIADIHLGAVPDSDMHWGNERKKEIWDSFNHVIDVCNDEKADLLLIAGDLFHKQPLIKELKEVNYCFTKLKTAQVVIMAGNHDHIGVRSAYPGFRWDERVHMFYRDTLETIYLPDINSEIYGFSYHTRDITEPLYDSIRPIQNNRVHILLAHGGDEKDIPMNKKRLMESGFDYIALGHIHKPEIINERIAYAGSLEPLDKNEIGEHGYILGEINQEEMGKTRTSIKFVSSSIRKYIRHTLEIDPETTKGAVVDLVKDAIKNNGTQNIYDICLKGFREEDIHFDMDELMSLGNIVDITDQTVPDYNFDALYRENADNIIGMFIRKIRQKEDLDEVGRKALYYGMEALLGAKDK